MKERSKLPLLLTELALMLLIFSLCSAVCLSVFASSRKTARESGALGNAAAWASSAAEVYRASKGDMEQAASVLGMEFEDQSASYVCCFDEDWQPVPYEESSYVLTMCETDENDASIVVAGSEGPLFSLDVKAVAYGS